MTADDFTHFDDEGAARMVDVSAKGISLRLARAEAVVLMRAETLEKIQQRDFGKGDVLQVARLAGILAAKQTASLIPLCHSIPLERVDIDFETIDHPPSVRIVATTQTSGKTGVEMEALTAASVCALTIYDMCKSLDREMEITQIRLLEKLGGKSGHFQRENSEPQSTPPPADAT